ncbi:MAG: phosphoglucosamine mutase [Bacillota bacterium]
MARLFGTDGVRGVANSELTPELAYKLGRAGAFVLTRKSKRPTVLVGRDPRISGDLLESALVAGLCSVGADARCLGVVTTPGVAYLSRITAADAGVMISASHNPVGDNGIKFFDGSGFKLPDATEDEIEGLVKQETDQLPRPTGAGVGRLFRDEAEVERYVDYLVHVGGGEGALAGVKVAVDCANGSASRVAPLALQRLGARVTAINAQPDGLNINVRCGSTHPDAMARAVREMGVDAGVAYDGDADRVIAADAGGNIVDGDGILAILAGDLMGRGALVGKAIVATVMSNFGLDHALAHVGAEVHRTRVGDRYVLEALRQRGLVLGGEQSGHIIMLEHNTTGDGIITSVELLGVVKRTGRPLADLASAMTRFPQVLVNVRVRDRRIFEKSDTVAIAIRQAEAELGHDGRVVVRPSGTEPLVRVMVEALDEERAHKVAEELSAIIRSELGGE